MKNVAILFEDDDCLVLNKPAGLAVQGGAGVGVSLDALLAAERDPAPLLVHRLDKDTSGVILAAKHKAAARRLSELIAGQDLEKIYLAVVAGRPEPPSGVIREALQIRGVRKEALTRYRCLGETGEFSLLELSLGSGRMHQIRRHLAHIGHPILGDDKYGDFKLNKRLAKERGLRKLLLHAYRLQVPQAGGSFRTILAPPPDYFGPFLGEPAPEPPLPHDA